MSQKPVRGITFLCAALTIGACGSSGCSGDQMQNDLSNEDTSMMETPRLSSSISELDGSETLLDTKTGLVWVNDVRFCMAGVTKPENAMCNVLGDMAVAGLTDWRLPSSAEMAEITLAVDADDEVTFNYINAACAVMTASDGWVFTENSNSPGVMSPIEPGNAGVRCVSGETDNAS